MRDPASIKLIADAWRDFEIKVIPLNAPDVQRTECRRAFYAGARTLLTGIVGMLDADKEPTEDDLKRMDAIQAELNQYQVDLREGG